MFTQRGQEQMAANCDAVRHKVEEFKAVVPLVQVSWGVSCCMYTVCTPLVCPGLHLACVVYPVPANSIIMLLRRR